VKDTPPVIERKFRQMLMKRSGEERLKMGCSMHATALTLAKASLSQQRPGAHPGELRRLLFLHFYGPDFEADERKRIASALSNSRQPAGTLKRGKSATRKLPRSSMPASAKASGAGVVREKGETYEAKRKTKANRRNRSR
jgi:hypothetical protein